MRLGIDLDGVLYDFTDSVRHHLVTNHGYEAEDLPDAEVWDFFQHQWGMSTHEFLAHADEGVDAGIIFRYGKPFAGQVEGLRLLADQGHTLHIVTDRKFGTMSPHNTVDWLAQYAVPYDSLTFAADKTLVNVDAFIDDKVENYLALDEADVAVFLQDRPWNRHLVAARRVVDMWAFADEVAKLEANR